MRTRIGAIVATPLIALLALTACSGQETPPDNASSSVSSIATTPVAMPTPSLSQTALSDEEVAANMEAKIYYLASQERIDLFTDAHLDTAKAKLAKDAMAGKFGVPTVEKISDETIHITAGNPDASEQGFADIFVVPDAKGNPDYSQVSYLEIQTPGHGYFMFGIDAFTYHQYIYSVTAVDFGSSRDAKDGMRTCVWQDVENERTCQNAPDLTSTITDIRLSDERAIRAMTDTMVSLYGPSWSQG